MTDNSKQKVYNKIAKVQDIGYAMNCIVYCGMCVLSYFRNHSDLCSAPSNVRTADSFDKRRFPWSQVTCTPVAHEGYLVRGEILATQKSYGKDNPKNVLTFPPSNRGMLRRSRCVLIFLLKHNRKDDSV